MQKQISLRLGWQKLWEWSFGHCVRVCEAWDVFLCFKDSAPECQFSCTSSWIMNHIMTTLLSTSTRPGGGKLLLLRVLTNGPALRAQQPLHIYFTCISSIHHLFAPGIWREITVERFVNRFKVCSQVCLFCCACTCVFPAWDTHLCDAEEEKEDSCSLFASLMEFN